MAGIFVHLSRILIEKCHKKRGIAQLVEQWTVDLDANERGARLII